jgi:hypothetical protein
VLSSLSWAGKESSAAGLLNYIETVFLRFMLLELIAVAALAQQQNPSPMVEHTRDHSRLRQESPEGRREKLSTGTLFIPEKIGTAKRLPLFVHFHGAAWVAEIAARDRRSAVITVQTGSGSGTYAKQFSDRGLFGEMLREAAGKTGVTFAPISLSAWSAGHGAIREILQVPEYYGRVQKVLLIDGLHTGYVGGSPGPLESGLEPDHLEIFLKFARDAVAGRKTLVITHSEIFPGTFASTTETADWLLAKLGLRRRAVLRWGPRRTQQLSEARAGKFLLLGYAGNSASDHVDEFHSLPEYLKLLDSPRTPRNGDRNGQ